MAQEAETKLEQAPPSIGEIIADLYQKIRQPYRWDQVWALAPLFCIRLAATIAYVLSVLGLLTAQFYSTLDWLLNAASAVCLFFLATAYAGYRPAAICMSVSLAISVLSAQMGSVPLLMVMAGLCAITSNFFEYSSHAHVASKQNGRLADFWNHLFLCVIGATFAGAFAFLLTLILSYLFEDMGLWILLVTYLPDLIVDILYLIYLGCTIHLVKHPKE